MNIHSSIRTHTGSCEFVYTSVESSVVLTARTGTLEKKKLLLGDWAVESTPVNENARTFCACVTNFLFRKKSMFITRKVDKYISADKTKFAQLSECCLCLYISRYNLKYVLCFSYQRIVNVYFVACILPNHAGFSHLDRVDSFTTRFPGTESLIIFDYVCSPGDLCLIWLW